MNNLKLELREYQTIAIREIYAQWKQGKNRVLFQLPTGGGKTFLFSAIAKDLLQERILVLVHREELLYQAKESLEVACNTRVGIIKSGVKPEPLCMIQVASVQSLVRRSLPPAGLVIIDECHHAKADTYRKILSGYPDSYILGVSATPIRTDGSGFDDLFDSLVSVISVKELIAQGHLSKYKLFADREPIKTKGIKTTAKDYNQLALANSVDLGALSGNLVQMYQNLSMDKRCVVFAINCDHSRAIADRYNQAGIRAEHLDGETPSGDRKAILERFRTGETLVVSNVGILTEGFNLPAIETVQIARPTKSLGLWLQMVGRALRPSEGKEHALVLDHTENWLKLGMPCAKHIWTLEGVEVEKEMRFRKKKNGEIEEDTDEFEIVEREAELEQIHEDDLDEIAVRLEIQQLEKLFAIAEAKNYKKAWATFRFLESKPSLAALKVCAEMMGYHPSWAKAKFAEIGKDAIAQSDPNPAIKSAERKTLPNKKDIEEFFANQHVADAFAHCLVGFLDAMLVNLNTQGSSKIYLSDDRCCYFADLFPSNLQEELAHEWESRVIMPRVNDWLKSNGLSSTIAASFYGKKGEFWCKINHSSLLKPSQNMRLNAS